MCLCLLPVHFFLINSKQKGNITFPILQKETKPKQTDKVQYKKIWHYKRQHDVQQQYQRNKNKKNIYIYILGYRYE